ncbi:MAG: carbonic anhydrase, partial [Rubrivivax sp.]
MSPVRLAFVSAAPARLPHHALRRVLPVALAACLTAGLLWPQATQASDPPVLKPVKLSPTREAHTAVHGPGKEVIEPPKAAPAPAAPPDPLEVLRQRLAGKLSGVKTTEGAGPYDVRVVAKTAPEAEPAAPPRPAAPRKAAAAQGGTSAHGASGSHGHWSYQGPAGPQTWGGLKPEFNLCGNGQRQSPIDIRGGLAVDLEPVKFNYQPSPFAVIDNGHTVQANLSPGNHVEIGGKRFDLVQFHFHRPSEERIDGRQFEMSVHLVHRDDQGKLAVVAVLLDKGQPQPAVQKVWNNLPLEKGEEAAARVQLDPAEILPTDRRYFTYMGSLTTPPCSEGVQWVVMRQPVTMSPEQLELFARIYPMNARPVQQA